MQKKVCQEEGALPNCSMYIYLLLINSYEYVKERLSVRGMNVNLYL